MIRLFVIINLRSSVYDKRAAQVTNSINKNNDAPHFS